MAYVRFPHANANVWSLQDHNDNDNSDDDNSNNNDDDDNVEDNNIDSNDDNNNNDDNDDECSFDADLYIETVISLFGLYLNY